MYRHALLSSEADEKCTTSTTLRALQVQQFVVYTLQNLQVHLIDQLLIYTLPTLQVQLKDQLSICPSER